MSDAFLLSLIFAGFELRFLETWGVYIGLEWDWFIGGLKENRTVPFGYDSVQGNWASSALGDDASE